MKLYNLDKIRNEFLDECREDYVGLWSLNWSVRNETGENPRTIRDITIGLLTKLLEEDLIKAGLPDEKGEFEEWHQSADEIIKRIQTDWDHLGREPDIGDIVWFTTSEKWEAGGTPSDR